MVLFSSSGTATTEIYTLSLHDALPISAPGALGVVATELFRRVLLADLHPLAVIAARAAPEHCRQSQSDQDRLSAHSRRIVPRLGYDPARGTPRPRCPHGRGEGPPGDVGGLTST